MCSLPDSVFGFYLPRIHLGHKKALLVCLLVGFLLSKSVKLYFQVPHISFERIGCRGRFKVTVS